MSNRSEALRLIREAGADFVDRSARGELTGDTFTPPGIVWHATGCHALVVHFRTDPAAGWAALLDDVRLGTEPCRLVDCENCETN